MWQWVYISFLFKQNSNNPNFQGDLEYFTFTANNNSVFIWKALYEQALLMLHFKRLSQF